jgi:low temperature requirement protein LtrA
VSDGPKPGAVSGGDTAERQFSSRFMRPQAMRNLTNEQRAEERTSTWLELFFDLCFVVAVAALARGLHHDPNLEGMLRFLGLFVPVWWSWMIFTWYATSFDNDDVPYRVTLFVAMLSILGLAASVGRIGVDPSAVVGFVLAYSLMRFLVAGLFVRGGRNVPADLRPFVAFYVAGNIIGATIWLSSLLVPAPFRYVVWAVGLAVELLGPILAVMTLDNPRITFHPRHIAERYGLFTLIVLGESVLAVASGTAGKDWAPATVLTAVVGFVAATCIWWLYFDHVGSSGIELGPRPAFYWGYGHFAVYAGIAAFGVGVQLAIEAAPEYALAAGAPSLEGYSLGARTVFAGGVILFLLGIAFVDRINEGTTNDRVLLARLGAVALLVLVTALSSPLSSVAFAVTVCLVLLALTAFETLSANPPAEPPPV